MKFIITILLMLWAVIILGVTGIAISPYYLYERSIHGNLQTQWFKMDDFENKLLHPGPKEYVKKDDSENNLTWNNFHFQDFLIPLPVKNPFFLVAPIINYENKRTQLGIRLYFPNGRTISKIFFVNQTMFPNALLSQKLFKLPIVKNKIKRVSYNQLWKDIFNKELGAWKIPYQQMSYNLYILQMRRLLFPKNFINFKLLEDSEDTAIITLDSKNKDYDTELILKKVNAIIYSYVLLSRKDAPESQKFRSRFLKEVKYRTSTSSLADIIYREFQALSYDDKIDHVGMLYLFSAWSHNQVKKDFIQEMITFLERGKGNESQLMPLYKYSVDRWGTTFTDRFVEGLTNDKIKLKRSIELEGKEIQKRLEEKQRNELTPPPKELSEKEKIQLRLRKAKQNKQKSQSSSMRLD